MSTKRVEMTPSEAEWLEHIQSDEVNAHASAPQLSDSRKFRLLEIAAKDLLSRVNMAPTFDAALPELRKLEMIGAETMRISVESDTIPGDLLETIARDFDRGDEDGEFRRIYEDLRMGRYR